MLREWAQHWGAAEHTQGLRWRQVQKEMRQGQGGRAAAVLRADGTHTEAGEHQEDFLCSSVAPALPLDIKPHQFALLSDKLGTNLCWGAQRERLVCSRGEQSLSISQATSGKDEGKSAIIPI